VKTIVFDVFDVQPVLDFIWDLQWRWAVSAF